MERGFFMLSIVGDILRVWGGFQTRSGLCMRFAEQFR
jgi:hypothetical protein